jgi:hypothetical protein
MKKLFLSLFSMFTIATAIAFTNADPGINEQVQESFKKEFAGAELVKWTTTGDYVKATFILRGYRTEAYFTQRTLFYNQLPLAVMTSLDKRFGNADVFDVSEITNSSGTTYRITLESKGKKYLAKVDTAGNLTDIQKLKK